MIRFKPSTFGPVVVAQEEHNTCIRHNTAMYSTCQQAGHINGGSYMANQNALFVYTIPGAKTKLERWTAYKWIIFRCKRGRQSGQRRPWSICFTIITRCSKWSLLNYHERIDVCLYRSYWVLQEGLRHGADVVRHAREEMTGSVPTHFPTNFRKKVSVKLYFGILGPENVGNQWK